MHELMYSALEIMYHAWQMFLLAAYTSPYEGLM